MDAVQRMRKKAQDNGALESTEQQKVETKVVEEKTVIIVESADPEVIYVPSYSPTVVYGPPVYPYPPIYYPPYSAGWRLRVVRRRGDVGRGVGRLVLRLRLGRQRHRHQHRQQLQPKQHPRRRPGERRRREVGAQLPAPWRDAVLGPGDGEQVRRIGARRFAEQPPGERPPAGRPAVDRHRQPRRGAPAPATARRAAPAGGPDTSGLAAHQAGGSGEPRDAAASASTRSSGAGASSADRVGSRSVPSSSGSTVRLERRLPRLQRLERPGQQLARRLEHGAGVACGAAAAGAAADGGDAMNTRNDARSVLRLPAAIVFLGLCLAFAVALAGVVVAADTPAAAAIQQKAFKTPEEAVEALIAAAEAFDVPALTEILGPDGVGPRGQRGRGAATGTLPPASPRRRARRPLVARDPENKKVAVLSVGAEDWPLPIPIVKEGGKWRFDTAAGREEVLYRRIGSNELDAIEVCLGYVEAQHEYAYVKHDGSPVNQYAQRIISTPGTQDGLAWQGSDGSWQGPVGEGIARAIAEGYSDRLEPYHGYYYKVLKGQGPDAPMGEMDFVVEGAMIGGFALVAAPAEYRVTGVKTFIVSHDGVVYEKDLGETTLEQFRAMERFNPDPSWEPVAGPP